jgi:hypothetical protein
MGMIFLSEEDMGDKVSASESMPLFPISLQAIVTAWLQARAQDRQMMLSGYGRYFCNAIFHFHRQLD